MPDDVSPQQPPEPAAAAALPDVEKMAESEDPALVSARAELLEAQARLTKASSPLVDRLIIRGLIPVALAIVGPWAAWTFSVEAQEAKAKATEVQENVTELQSLLEGAKAESERRRLRFQQIEEAKAVELAAMSAMVTRLDNTMKLALIQMAVARVMSDPSFARSTVDDKPSEPGTGAGPSAEPATPWINPRPEPPSEPRSYPIELGREEVLRDVAQQVQLPGLDPEEVKRIAGEQYDRVMEQRRR